MKGTLAKIPVQFKVSKEMLADIDNAMLDSDYPSRNLWMVAAAKRQLARSWSVPYRMTAYYLLHNRKTIMVRIDEPTLDAIDDQCDEMDIERTLWLVDAMISYIAEHKNGHSK